MNTDKNQTWHSLKVNWRAQGLLVWLVCAACLLPLDQANAQTSQKTHMRYRAAFIYQVAKFVNWSIPKEAPLTFCFFKNTNQHNVIEVLSSLQRSGKLKVQGHEVKLTVMDSDKTDSFDHYQSCSLIYFDHDSAPDLPEALLVKLSKTKLTIGSKIEFITNGGLSALVPKKGKLKLYVNRASYQFSSVRIRSRLLALARFYPE